MRAETADLNYINCSQNGTVTECKAFTENSRYESDAVRLYQFWEDSIEGKIAAGPICLISIRLIEAKLTREVDVKPE